MGGPAEGGGDAGAAFVEVEFCATIGGVATGAGDSSVVAVEDDQGVVGVGPGFHGVEDLSDGAVHGGDHGGVGAALFIFDGRIWGEVGFSCLKGGVGSIEGEVEEIGFFGG